MTEPNSGRSVGQAFHTVQNTQQARLLTDAAIQAYLRPFLAREWSATQAAEEVGCSLNVMLYRVKTFVEAGLLYVVREEKRKGRPIKIYRSVHDAYFIPYEVTPFASLEERLYAQMEPDMRELAQLLAKRMRSRGWEGQRLYRDTYGEPWMEGAPDVVTPINIHDPERPVGLDFRTDIYLEEAEARELQELLYSLMERSQVQRKAVGKKGYKFNVALVPTEV